MTRVLALEGVGPAYVAARCTHFEAVGPRLLSESEQSPLSMLGSLIGLVFLGCL